MRTHCDKGPAERCQTQTNTQTPLFTRVSGTLEVRDPLSEPQDPRRTGKASRLFGSPLYTFSSSHDFCGAMGERAYLGGPMALLPGKWAFFRGDMGFMGLGMPRPAARRGSPRLCAPPQLAEPQGCGW